MYSLVLWGLSSCRGPSWLWNLNGKNTGRQVWGHPGPLASVHHSLMACAIICWPSHRLNALALSWACLPTQFMAPDSVNMVSWASPNLRPSPRDCLSYNRMAWPGPVTTASIRPDLPSQGMCSTTGTSQACGVVVQVPHLWLRSLEFPNNTESQGSEAFASLLRTGMVSGMGCYQTPPSLWGHFGHLVVWGCIPPSGW